MYSPEGIRSTNLSMEDLVVYLQQELSRISAALQLVEQGRFAPVMYNAPERPRDGTLVYADGVSWNPGSGMGFYEYRSGAWYKL